MRVCLFLIAISVFQLNSFAAVNDTILNRLDKAISNKQYYADKKRQEIFAIRTSFSDLIAGEQEYVKNQQLYEAYRKFRIDSALFYVNRNIALAENLHNPNLKKKALIQQAYLYSSTGRYLESEKILNSINGTQLPDDLKELYYEFYYRLLEHYSANNPNEKYSRQIEVYRDSLLAILQPQTDDYRINLAQHYIYRNDLSKADSLLNIVLSGSRSRDDTYAMATYLIGDILRIQNDHQRAVQFYALAALADVENANNDHGAIQNLSVYYYYNGNIDRAYRYAKSALEDAVFCNVKFRTLMMSEFYSIINAAYQEKELMNKKKLEKYLLLISVLTVFLGATIIYVYRQMKKTSRVKETLFMTSQQLEQLNNEILETNRQLKSSVGQLHESNRVKEEYITQFFDLCSSYIDKMENYRMILNRNAMNKQFEEITRILKSTDFTNTELQELYKRFDLIFVNLYPGFVEEFNALLQPEQRIILREGEWLNTELRIFALERLGITDSVRIAAFLRCSISTVYNYRTKARNRSAVSREEFENSISQIGKF